MENQTVGQIRESAPEFEKDTEKDKREILAEIRYISESFGHPFL